MSSCSFSYLRSFYGPRRRWSCQATKTSFSVFMARLTISELHENYLVRQRDYLMKTKQRMGVAFLAAGMLPLPSPVPLAAAQEPQVFYREGVQSGAIVIEPWMVATAPDASARRVDDDPSRRFERSVRWHRGGYLLFEAATLGLGTSGVLFYALNVSSEDRKDRRGAWAMLGVAAFSIPGFVFAVQDHVAFERNVREARRWLTGHNWQLAIAPTATRQHAGLAARLQW